LVDLLDQGFYFIFKASLAVGDQGAKNIKADNRRPLVIGIFKKNLYNMVNEFDFEVYSTVFDNFFNKVKQFVSKVVKDNNFCEDWDQQVQEIRSLGFQSSQNAHDSLNCQYMVRPQRRVRQNLKQSL
jgi:hypothetical protein